VLQAGAARNQPRKKTLAACRRFVCPVPNECWQLYATEYVPAGRRRMRDLPAHRRQSRYAVVSDAAVGETHIH